MIVQNALNKAKNFLAKALQFNLFASLISLPFLVSWGLPISILSPIGNLVFAPFLTIFLLVSSLLFFCEILHIPNGILALLLNYITIIWGKSLGFGSKYWLIGFPSPKYIWILAIIPLATLAIIQFKKFSRTKIIIAMALLYVLSGLLLGYKTQPTITTINCPNGTVDLVHAEGQTVLVDHGSIGWQQSADTWVEYNLTQSLIKLVGSMTIDHLVLLRPTKTLFSAVSQMSKILKVKNVHLVRWDGKLEKREWMAFKEMLKTLKTMNVNFKRLTDNETSISLGNTTRIDIKPTGKTIRKGLEAVHPIFSVTVKQHNKLVSLGKTAKIPKKSKPRRTINSSGA